MEKINDNKTLKMIELGIMKEIHLFCVEHHICYFLWGGSLIGAVRHNGFIPWDDDIDIAMPRADYDRFMNEFKSNRYQFLSCEKSRRYPYPYGKVIDKTTIKIEPISCKMQLGVDVDVFPIDCFYCSAVANQTIIKRMKIIEKLSFATSLYLKPTSFKAIVVNIYMFFLKIMSKSGNSLSRKLGEMAQNGKENLNKYMLFVDPNIKRPFIIEGDSLGSFNLCKFEDSLFFIPKGYDEILRDGYGDYMQLPPEEERITHHSSKCFYK